MHFNYNLMQNYQPIMKTDQIQYYLLGLLNQLFKFLHSHMTQLKMDFNHKILDIKIMKEKFLKDSVIQKTIY